MADDRDTIFALSSGQPPAAIAVIRLSGPQARFALETVAGRLPEPRRASLARLRDPATAEPVDDALILWLPGPRTETGEDMAELHLHGGRAVVSRMLELLGRLEGLRSAEAGEFTRRSFENGRLDLTAVEGLGDLIAAETEAQRRLAYRQLGGALGSQAEAWRQGILEGLALVEATIDFSDEEDVPEGLIDRVEAGLRSLAAEIDTVLRSERRSERLREGLTVAIAGPPNAGKSSLLNRIARRDAAIVSPHPGTTRDVIEVHLDLDGYPLTLLDTAGIRDSFDPVELEGIRRARARAAAADLLLWVSDAQAPPEAQPATLSEAPVWHVRNKIDLIDSATDHPHQSPDDRFGGGTFFPISAKTGAGLDALLEALAAFVADRFAGAESALISRQRHRQALQDTLGAIHRALTVVEVACGQDDLLAEELRMASRALARLTGRIDVEDILEVIFRDFCIGK